MVSRPGALTPGGTDQVIADPRGRLVRPRFLNQTPGEAWAYGTDLGYTRRLVEYCHRLDRRPRA